MEFINAVKGIIEKFREEGKTEKEISGIVEAAAEKATANRGNLKKDEKPKSEIKVESIAEAFQRLGITTKQAKEAICKMGHAKGCEERRNTNNWRRMHGLPMRRKRKAGERHERRKGADCH